MADTPARPKATFTSCLALALLMYITSYLALSTVRMRTANLHGVDGYFFVDPATEKRLALHFVLCNVFAPLIALDRFLDLRPQPIANRPMTGLSLNNIPLTPVDRLRGSS